jgi:hypothetical protein
MNDRLLGEPRETGSDELDGYAVAALILGILALLFTSITQVAFLTKPLACLGLVLGVKASLTARRERTGVGLPFAASAMCLFTVGFAGPWRIWPGAPASSPVVNWQRVAVIPKGDKGMTLWPTVDIAEWVDVSRATVQHNDVRLRVIGVTIGPLPNSSSSRSVLPGAGKNYLLVRVAVSNAGAVRLVEYGGWGDKAPVPGRYEPRLTDNLDRRYEHCPPGDREGSARPIILTPGRTVEDVLVYEPPPLDDVTELRLELPAAAYGGTGTLRLKIPRSTNPKDGTF